MSHVDVPLAGTATHKIEIRSGGSLKDPDANTVTPVIITPTGGSNPPTVPATATRLSTGVYQVTITALSNTTLTSNLPTGNDWQIRYDFAINSSTPAAAGRTFTFDVVPAAEVTENAYYSSVLDVRRNFLESVETQTGKTGTTLTYGRRDGVDAIFVKKNGVELTKITSGSPTSTQYKFTAPNVITLGAAAVSSDVFDLNIAIYLTDAEVEEYLNDVHRKINSKVAIAYTLPFSSIPPILASIEREWSQYDIVRNLAGDPQRRIGEKEITLYKERYADAMQLLSNLVSGDQPLLDQDDIEIPRDSVTTDAERFISFESSASDGALDTFFCGPGG